MSKQRKHVSSPPLWASFEKQPTNRMRKYNIKEEFGSGCHIATIPSALNHDKGVPMSSVKDPMENAGLVEPLYTTTPTGASESLGADFDLQVPYEHYILDGEAGKSKLLTKWGIFWLCLFNRWLPKLGYCLNYGWKPQRLRKDGRGYLWDA